LNHSLRGAPNNSAELVGRSGAVNSLTENIPMKATAIRRATMKDRLFTACYLAATAVAMIGWLSAFGWVTVAVAKWVLA
jgi:hypothetical protein